MTVPIGPVGRITKGDDVGSFVKVIDDAQNTGGFHVLTSLRPDMSDAFDDWVENIEALNAYFSEAQWEIAWAKA